MAEREDYRGINNPFYEIHSVQEIESKGLIRMESFHYKHHLSLLKSVQNSFHPHTF